MNRIQVAAALLLACVLEGAGQQAPVASYPRVEIAGRIARVDLARGQGMPSLEVKAEDGRVWKVWLGSMRYLVEQGFNPKAGQQLSAQGFRQPDAQELTAVSVTLTETKQTIRLRDESGRPLWRGRRGGR